VKGDFRTSGLAARANWPMAEQPSPNNALFSGLGKKDKTVSSILRNNYEKVKGDFRTCTNDPE
jgi:hypothetical protein